MGTKDDFVKLQFDLVTDVLEMEFTRFHKRRKKG